MGRSYAPMLLQMSPASTMIERQRELAQKMFDQTEFASPCYDLVDDENKFQLSVDIPGVKQEDIDIQLGDGFLTIKGHREASSQSSRFSSRFSQSFSLDPSVNLDQFSASLNNGVLVVSAPKDVKKLEESTRRIPVSAGAPLEATAAKEEANEEKQQEKTEIPTDSDEDSEEIDLDAGA